MEQMESAKQPLSGIRVLELGSFITAPLAGMMLADLGADVIKIERPGGGDPFRAFAGGLYSPHFRAYNRSKKSVSLDITSPAGKEVLIRLIEQSDVLVENFRPGWMDAAGLSYENLSKHNPRLIYCSITGFGPDGPYRTRPSYDTVGQAMSGLLSLYVDPADPRSTGSALSDNITGIYACYGVLGALLLREKSGHGTKVETNMLESTMAFSGSWFVEYFLSNEVPGVYHKAHRNQSFALRCSDGKLIAVHLSSPPKFWEGLLTAIAKPEMGQDTRFHSRSARVENYEQLREKLAAIFCRHPRAFWISKLTENDVPFAPIYNLDEVTEDPQVKFLNTFIDLHHPTEGLTRTVRRPVNFEGGEEDVPTAPPVLGEHTDEVLGRFGYSQAEIDHLRSVKLI
jgi:formyl-CoA transferase